MPPFAPWRYPFRGKVRAAFGGSRLVNSEYWVFRFLNLSYALTGPKAGKGAWEVGIRRDILGTNRWVFRNRKLSERTILAV